jgi:hypothetical protein
MKQIGWWIVGDDTAKFGTIRIGQEFISMSQYGTAGYWQNRGYDVVPAYVNELDVDEWGVYEGDEE